MNLLNPGYPDDSDPIDIDKIKYSYILQEVVGQKYLSPDDLNIPAFHNTNILKQFGIYNFHKYELEDKTLSPYSMVSEGILTGYAVTDFKDNITTFWPIELVHTLYICQEIEKTYRKFIMFQKVLLAKQRYRLATIKECDDACISRWNKENIINSVDYYTNEIPLTSDYLFLSRIIYTLYLYI